jgi:tRNA pseudouridine synthase 10
MLNGQTTCTISAQHDSIYVAGYRYYSFFCIFDQMISSFLGRYNKYSRTLSQTPWIIDGIRKADESVEELIALPISKLVKSKCKN